MDGPAAPSCLFDQRELAIGALCWPCHHHLADLLSDRPGSVWNPARPDDPYSPPGVAWLLAAAYRHDGQRAVRPEPGAPPPGGFCSASPGDDTIIALRDWRSRADDHLPWLLGQRWLVFSAGQLAEHSEVATARTELRALQRALLALLGDAHGARWVGTCRTLVDIDGTALDADALSLTRARAHEAGATSDGVYTCAAPLWSRPTPPCGDDETPPLPSVRCSSCATVYGGLSLARMGRIDVDEQEAA